MTCRTKFELHHDSCEARHGSYLATCTRYLDRSASIGHLSRFLYYRLRSNSLGGLIVAILKLSDEVIMARVSHITQNNRPFKQFFRN